MPLSMGFSVFNLSIRVYNCFCMRSSDMQNYDKILVNFHFSDGKMRLFYQKSLILQT